MVTRVGILTVVRHTTKWQPALGLAEEKLQQQTKTSSAQLYKIKVGTDPAEWQNEWKILLGVSSNQWNGVYIHVKYHKLKLFLDGT